ncbi:MAG: phosphosulfolactate synthase [Tenuifilum sp.]|jgi:phosphosulfolactate synthase|uniref:Phosphosulfolactate synthase n=1 Tax=Tenuifilum thalassicum TaxID=2590900 RepID=A0A7D3XM16_9BACT|nr:MULTISPECIES: phosphosulfolactate synthase [Tenuifilum]MDI3527841.1 phosphosulfolactate synthase [Tenuifilum sp.]QKG79856.1 phosphosulfolactate synthase [Tenuifilum thalassicum]
MNYNLTFIPARTEKPREYGLTMVMDKGLSLNEAQNLIESSGDYVDFVKLGFGTSLITKNLKEKIKLYQDAGLRPYLGGTLFEIFVIRGLFDGFVKFVEELGLDLVEVSDGSMELDNSVKCDYISELAKRFTVISEVGSKRADVHIPDEEWINMMKNELEAGSWKVIAEARESGTVGIYNKDHSANTKLIDDIVRQVKVENVIWEAPIKSQQAWFIKTLGANVNLGNIAPNEVIALETLRLGLRGDTFFQFLPENMSQK